MVRRDKERLVMPPAQPLPWLVFSHGGKQTFYDIKHGKSMERSLPWLRYSLCRATAYEWLLLQDVYSHKFSLFHPTTMQRLSVPKTKTEINDEFICCLSSPPDGPDSHVIAIHRREGYFLCCQPRGTEWMEYNLEFGEYNDVHGAVACNGKIYVSSGQKLLVIEFVSCPMVSYIEMNMEHGPYSRYSMDSHLVESCGDVYEVTKYLNGDYSSFYRTVMVHKLCFSSYTWRVVKSIQDRVFTIGEHYSMSFSATLARVKGNCIHFCNMDGVFYSFDMKLKSLTADFPFGHVSSTSEPYWLWLDQPMIKKARSLQQIEEDRSGRGLPQFKEIQHFDRPKSFSMYSIRDQCTRRGAAPLTWSSRTPYLIFTDRYDDIFKVLDPCSNQVYELHIPELLDRHIYSSKDGWLLLSGKPMFFFQPFTKKRVDLPYDRLCFISGITFSSTLASEDCVIFGIFGFSDETVNIYLFRFSDQIWNDETYTNNQPFQLTHNCPVYHNGLFCCLGRDGNLGVYDPMEDTWNVIGTHLSFDVPVGACFLVESNNELLSVFIDIYENPIGVFVMDFCQGTWRKVTHLGDGALFVGMEASFCATTVEQRMANKIYLPKFHGEYSHDLVFHHVGMENLCKPRKRTEYTHVWVKPEGVTFGLDQTTGKCMLPAILLPSDQ